MASKQDYVATAHILKVEIEASEGESYEAVERIALEFAHIYEAGNTRFNRKRFLDACGVNG